MGVSLVISFSESQTVKLIFPCPNFLLIPAYHSCNILSRRIHSLEQLTIWLSLSQHLWMLFMLFMSVSHFSGLAVEFYLQV